MPRSSGTTYATAKRDIIKRFSQPVWDDLLAYVTEKLPRPWAQQRPADLPEIVLVATCIKYCNAVSYARLKATLASKIHLANRALQHNVKSCLKVCRRWARHSVRRGHRAEWDAAVAERGLPRWMKAVRFWMDSVDVRIAKRKEVRSRKGNAWSAKLVAPGRRFMALSDGASIIRKAWRGYSPKKYDADFCVEQKEYLEDRFGRTAILADGHFWSAGAVISDLQIIAPPPEQLTLEVARERCFASTKSELKSRRRDVRHFRGIVESPFSEIKRIFKSLSGGPYEPWRESMSELDDCVQFACAVANAKRILN